jgi:Haem-NO-binding
MCPSRLVHIEHKLIGLFPPLHKIMYNRKRGYDGLLRSMGRDLFTWLQSVNDLHNHLRTQLDKNLLFPEIYCVREDKSDTSSFITHYRSARGALLAPLVVGIIKKVADVYFSSTVSIDRLATQGEDGSEFTSWRVTITGAITRPPGYVEEDEEGAGGKAFEEADEMQKLALMVAQTSTSTSPQKKTGRKMNICSGPMYSE